MEHRDDAEPGRADRDQIWSLYLETGRALEEAPGRLRQLRVHCLREKSHALLAALERQPQRLLIPA